MSNVVWDAVNGWHDGQRVAVSLERGRITTTPDYSHLDALQSRLGHERARWNAAKTDAERESRRVTVAGVEREIESELEFLGFGKLTPDELAMSDDELLAELTA